ncbi:lipase family protein [Corynebacterium cystitidis]|uniref:lipase family protein n=1 Tax=Corynebacterium cystitidis TaxID=35757 RepID=UPI000B897223|nr:lipase family protein [Corynebacterium cystitidis]
MACVIARTLLPFCYDLLRRRRGADPDDAKATWVIGGTPGTLIHARRIPALGLNTRLNHAHAWRITYVTSDAENRTITSTGVVFRSNNPWQGAGPRPTIAFAPSTQGVAPHCDPSYSSTVGLEFRGDFDFVAAYEQPVINLMVAAGSHVVVTDYPRDPEDNIQLYCDHGAASHALADAVRAAASLGVGHENLALWGFSQGGGAVGTLLEHPEYCPELQPQAAVVGAPPADLVATLKHVDGGLATVVIAYAAAGLAALSPAIRDEISSVLNDRGLALLRRAAEVCVSGGAQRVTRAPTSTWTISGRSLAELLDDLPATGAVLDQRRLGTRSPLIPVRLWGSVHDDIVPYSTVVDLADAWGVELQTRRLPRIPGRNALNHFLPYFQHATSDVRWLLSQLGR